MKQPQLAETVFFFNKPWEGPSSTYVTVLQDNNRFRLYYRGAPYQGKPAVTCVAESVDGIHWDRPVVGLFPFQGSTENNIVWTGESAHNFAPFLDTNPAAPAGQRYKAIAGEPPLALASADGIHWEKLQDNPIMTEGEFDSQNVAFWDSIRGVYSAYYRIYSQGGRRGFRTIAGSTSTDFIHWTRPMPIDTGPAPQEHLYTSAVAPYFRAPHLLLGFPMRFIPGRRCIDGHPLPGLSDTLFMSSRDGIRFDRHFMESFIRPGRDHCDWIDRSNMTAWGILPTGRDELSLYVTRHFHQDTVHLQRFTLRTDGFTSLYAPYSGGECLTRPLVFQGSKLAINYATSAAGSIRIELQDLDGAAVPGFSLSDCREIFGDEIERVVDWQNGSDLESLAGRPIRLRIALQDSDIFSFQFKGDME